MPKEDFIILNSQIAKIAVEVLEQHKEAKQDSQTPKNKLSELGTNHAHESKRDKTL